MKHLCFLLLATFALAQQSTVPAAPVGRSTMAQQTSAAPHPARILVSTSTRSIDAPSEFAASGSPQCDADGNIYLHTGIQGSYRDSPILRLSASAHFKLYKLPADDVSLGEQGEMSVAPDGTLWLALSRSDGTTLLRFNSDGEVTSRVNLEGFASFVLENFVAFNNDVFFVTGFQRPSAADRTIARHAAMVNASGQELSTPKLGLPNLDLPSRRPPEGGAAAGSDGNLYLLQSQEVAVISQPGEVVRHLRFGKPDSEYRATDISVSGGLVAIWLAKPDEQQRVTTEFLVIDAVSGKEFGRYTMGTELRNAMPVCFSRQDGFTFLGGIRDGKMKLITAALP